MSNFSGAYAFLAPLYDRLSDRDIDYAGWSAYYCALAQLKRPMTVLEAGCGTGKMTAQLLKRGLRVTATDISQQMLTVAGETCRRMGTVPVLACADMRTIKAHKPVDAVLCVCDGVNYLLTDEDLAAFFASAYAALKPGGMLAFDFSSAQKLAAMDGQIYYDDRDDVTCLWTNALEEDRIRMDLAFFVKRKDGLYERVDETHLQRLYEPELVSTLLAQAGFEQIEAVWPEESVSWRRGRIHMTARKPK